MTITPTQARRSLTTIAIMDILRASLSKAQAAADADPTIDTPTIDELLTALTSILRFDAGVYNAQVAMQRWIDSIPHDLSDTYPTADTYIGKD